MIWESYILGIMTSAIGAGPIGRRGLLINNECALDIDLHRTRMNDGVVYFRSVGECPRSLDGCILSRGIAISLSHSRRHDEKQIIVVACRAGHGKFLRIHQM
jgi:hypothetical protein